MRKFAWSIFPALLAAQTQIATAADPVSAPPPQISTSWDGCGYTTWVGYTGGLSGFGGLSPYSHIWIQYDFSRFDPQPDPSPTPAPLYTGPYILLQPSQTMTLNTDDPAQNTPPTMTLNTDDPPAQGNNTPKPPDDGTDVVPVVGDLGGPPSDSGKKTPPPDDTIGLHYTGSESGQTFALMSPEHMLPWSSPVKLDGGYDLAFPGCTTGLDNTCTASLKRSELSSYGFGKLSLSSAYKTLDFKVFNYGNAPPIGDDACRSKQVPPVRQARASIEGAGGHDGEIPSVTIHLRSAR
ncbi:hypothetical protein [Bradyrhizobium commune]|uniref:Secreted protein n=1 Tax=Bradyrhizobium commune TaxID=83627 RepID=A0A7S9D4K5_9BRAD|nr:hypothetical protein [Bradyrhizobium commune]QPF91073.1 hypothetical protein IC761_32190 [Bradyrhizobium commune]